MFKAVALGSGNQWQAAMAEVAKMRAMNVAPATLQFLAPILMSLGRFDEAVEILEANLREEPINLHARGFLLAAHEMSGNRMQARLEYDLGEELNPEWWGDTVNVFLAMGRKEHIRDISGLLDIPDDVKRMLESINQDDITAVTGLLSSYDPETRAGTVELVYYSAIAAYTGKHELAVDLMARAVAEVGLNIHWMWLPVFDETRKSEDFKTLLVQAGLVDYWQEYGWPPYCGPVGESFSCEASAYDMISMQ
jgi:tetratricopeptide (TPR) repeat protein